MTNTESPSTLADRTGDRRAAPQPQPARRRRPQSAVRPSRWMPIGVFTDLERKRIAALDRPRSRASQGRRGWITMLDLTTPDSGL